ncbi:putative ceramide kinase-like [Capsicum annuum]|nr:putative ceramide kinase-like [Capsicum annuum]
MFVSFGGLGCKGKFSSPLAPSTPEVIRSAAAWESSSRQMRKNTKRMISTLSRSSTRNSSTNVVCCAPPGIGSAFDVAPRTRTRSNNRGVKEATGSSLGNSLFAKMQDKAAYNTLLWWIPSPDLRVAAPDCPFSRFLNTVSQHSRIARRTANGEETSRFHASNTRHQCPRAHHRPPIMILRQNLQFARDLEGDDDQYGSWRLDVDDMSYEQLVELSDRIGYVGTGLAEEKIVQCIRKFKLSTTDSYSMLISTDKTWRCTICQEGYKVDDEIGKLECGHYHHIECIKKWLMQKNACPICKIAAIHEID